MPPLETMDRRDKAVYWGWVGNDRRGQPLVSDTPVEKLVRWVNKRREVLKPDGTVIAVDVTVVADFQVPVGSIMWLGGLDDIPGTSLVPESDLYEVVTSNVTEDIKARGPFTRYEATLMRFNNKLPRA